MSFGAERRVAAARWLRGVIVILVMGLPLGDGGAKAAELVGVVLMHGKAGSPEHVGALAATLTSAGYLVATPDMPWSGTRRYDRSLTDAHAEIDALVGGLRAQGATRMVIGGHSMGGNMAMGYAATHPGIAAVLAIGPGQTVEGANFLQAVGEGVARARAMIAEGRGDETAVFPELHLGRVSTTATTATIYASYFDPNGLANMPSLAPRITAPLLWVVGTRDRMLMDRGRTYAFDRMPGHASSRYAEVPSDHMGTPDVAQGVILDWLNGLFR